MRASRDYEKIKDRFRPGHADYTYQQKYGFRDYRGGGRSSARITVATVAAGAIARKYLREKAGHRRSPAGCRRSGPHRLDCVDPGAARGNPFFCADPDKLPLLEDYLRQLRTRRRFRRRARHGRARAACRRASASRCSTGSTPTSRSR